MGEEAPRKTFPKKPNSFTPKKVKSFTAKKEQPRKKAREASYGGTVLQEKPVRYFQADLTEEGEGISRKTAKQKVTKGMKKAKNSKVKSGNVKKMDRKRGEAVKGTCIEHKMLGGSDDEMYASEDDIVDVSDMMEETKEEESCATVPMVNTRNLRQHPAENVKHENGEPSSFSKNLMKTNGSEVKRKAVGLDDDVQEKVVEFSTGRGSSRLVFSEDDDDQVDSEPLEKLKKTRKISAQIPEDSESDFEEELHERDEKLSKRQGAIPITSEVVQVDNDEEEEQEEVAAFRAEMANLPLGKVREMKEKLGLKLFNKAYFGTNVNDEKKEQSKKKALEEKKKEHRGQHRPKEISSKKPVSVFRPLYSDMKGRKKKWDPRFDSRAGEFKERCFEDNYSFLNDLRKQEREELSKQAEECDECGDEEMAERIREAIRRMDNRERTKAERKLKEETYRELRQENIDRMMRGERPVFKTKAKVRLMHMEKKFEQLKKDNKLDSYMKRKAKKEARREAKRKPTFEQKYGYQE